MHTSFDLIADRLLERGPESSRDVLRIADCIRLANLFYDTSGTQSAQFTMNVNEVDMSGMRPLGNTMLVCAPSCSAAVIAKHVVASLAAGNSVELVLFESPTALLALLVTIVQEVISPSMFSVVSERTGWRMAGGNPAVVVVTETDAFMNDEAGEWTRDSVGEAATRDLIEFYSQSSTVRIRVSA